jgi:tetratricopeptide (TPR) repeat protein
MDVYPRRRLFHRQNQNNIYRIFFYTILTIAGLWIVYGVDRGTVQPMGLPTLTPTRASASYASEADARFAAGDIPGAVEAYKRATEVEPNNAEVWARLARIQAYSSALTTTDTDRMAALDDALFSANQAKAIDPESSTVAAIRAFALDWKASYTFSAEEKTALLFEAEQEAARALQLDNTNTLALVFYAEILIDQQKWSQGEQYLSQSRESGADLWDWHRVYANYLESQGAYSRAIEEYDRAIALAPNMTFLYIYAGANYRQLAFSSPIKSQQEQLYERSLEYFARAASINEGLGLRIPFPYLSISRTYSQTGDYFSAALNLQKALDYKPTDPDIYGQLGIVFRKSRNYEGSNMAFKCAIEGCDPEESCLGRYGRECIAKYEEEGVEVEPLPLTPNTIVYFYSYASNLAALSRPKENFCPDARRVMKIIIDGGYGSDPLVQQILAENENICQIVDRGGILALRTPTATPEGGTPQPGNDLMIPATPTPTPGP